jgi:adenylate cyclase
VSSPGLPQRLAAILAADIAGYTRLMELDESGTVAAWQRARAEVIDPTIAEHHGRIVKLTGDGFLAEFSVIESAVRAALSMQRQFAALFAPMPAERRVAFRMGVNLGDIFVDRDDVYGAGVNLAARLEALAEPGAICISDAVRAAIAHKIEGRYEDLGRQRVKNVATPVHIWRLSDTAKGSRTGRRPSRRSATFAGIGLATAAAIVTIAVLAPRPDGNASDESVGTSQAAIPSVETDSIAVLPFLNIDGTEEMRIFGDGLADDVINRLTATPPLRVSSRGDSFSLGPDSSSQDVRTRLRVAYYVRGSVRRTADNHLRVVANLIDSGTGFNIVSRTFAKSVGDFSELQEELTQLIVANLRVALPSLAAAPVYVPTETPSFDAYLAYRRGMDILERPLTPASLEQALAAFGESLAVDADYAAAFAGICLTHSAAFDVLGEVRSIASAQESCGNALERNPNLIVVHDALGQLFLRTGRDAEAERSFARALMLYENDVQALLGLARAYTNLQRLADAEQQYRQAVGLQPGNWRTYNELGRFLYRNGRYREAATAYREIVTLDPDNATGWANLASASMLGGDFVVAAHALGRSMALEPSPRTLMNAGMVHYYLGDVVQATALLEQAIAGAPEDYLPRSNLGDVLTLAGDAAAANEAFVAAERLARTQLNVNAQDSALLVDLAWITAMLGRLDESRELVDRAMAMDPDDPYAHFYDALIHARVGNTEAALDRLETAIAKGYSRAMVRAEPHLAALRGQARFAKLVAD